MSKQPASKKAMTVPASGISDRKTLRANARRSIEDGAITPSYAADRKMVIKLLNDALATEWVCVLRYYRHYFMAKGMLADAVKAETGLDPDLSTSGGTSDARFLRSVCPVLCRARPRCNCSSQASRCALREFVKKVRKAS